MTLIIEDGTGVTGAESYATTAFCDTYHSNRGNAAWAALTTAQKEEALRRATDYMMQVYRKRWAGYRYATTQALDWPRIYVPIPDALSWYGMQAQYVDTNVVPTEVKNACAEFALKASSASLLADQEQQIVREKIGPLETEYDNYSPQAKRYPAVDAIVAVYFATSGGGVQIIRN